MRGRATGPVCAVLTPGRKKRPSPRPSSRRSSAASRRSPSRIPSSLSGGIRVGVRSSPPCRTATSSVSGHRFRGRDAAVRHRADLPVAPQVGVHLRASRVPSGLRVGASGYGPWRKRRMMECSGHLLRHHRPCRRLRSTRSPVVMMTMTITSPSPPGCGRRRRASLRPHPSLARPREHPPGLHRHRAPIARRAHSRGSSRPGGLLLFFSSDGTTCRRCIGSSN